MSPLMPPVLIAVPHDSDRGVLVVAQSRRNVVVESHEPPDGEINPGGSRDNRPLEVNGPGADQGGSRKLPASGAMEEDPTQNFPQRAARAAKVHGNPELTMGL